MDPTLAFLGIPQDTESAKSHKDYFYTPTDRFETAYETTYKEAKKSATRQKESFNLKDQTFRARSQLRRKGTKEIVSWFIFASTSRISWKESLCKLYLYVG